MEGINLWSANDGYCLDSRNGCKRCALRFRRNCCVVYTDMFLDDLCALEELSHRYDVAYIVTVNEDMLDGNTYGSDNIHDVSDVQAKLVKWFSCAVLTTDTISSNKDDVSECDCYLLANATKIVADLENGVRFNTITAMIGSDSKGRIDDDEWNASQDILSFQKLLKNYVIRQFTHDDCVELYESRGYGSNSYEFLDEYVHKMKAINDDLCCFDLQAVL